MTATFESIDPHTRRRMLAVVAGRSFLVAAGLLAIYFVIPLGGINGWKVAIWAVAGMFAVLLAVLLQARAIQADANPLMRAVQGITMAVTLLVVIFAASYAGVSEADATTFTEPLGRIDALYFTVTTMTTVGFGDIAPRSDAARVLVTGQMVANLVVLGVALRFISAVARESSRAARAGHPSS